MRSKDQSIQDMTNQLKQHKTDHKLELKNKLQVHVSTVYSVHVQFVQLVYMCVCDCSFI